MKSRFKVLSNALGYKNKTQLATALGVDPSYISQLIKAGALNDKFRENLSARFPQANLDYLETGKGEPVRKKQPQDKRKELIESIKNVLELLDEPARQVIFESIKEYQKSHIEPSPQPEKKA